MLLYFVPSSFSRGGRAETDINLYDNEDFLLFHMNYRLCIVFG
jgi:hypothetical protein